mmetsp:Transcript_77691/g.207560  ORF Transcript_77691/g.207560 Transcript_77691/m.207560 type:complete len:256 (+) Transcript_77691:189-956(+)
MRTETGSPCPQAMDRTPELRGLSATREVGVRAAEATRSGPSTRERQELVAQAPVTVPTEELVTEDMEVMEVTATRRPKRTMAAAMLTVAKVARTTVLRAVPVRMVLGALGAPEAPEALGQLALGLPAPGRTALGRMARGRRVQAAAGQTGQMALGRMVLGGMTVLVARGLGMAMATATAQAAPARMALAQEGLAVRKAQAPVWTAALVVLVVPTPQMLVKTLPRRGQRGRLPGVPLPRRHARLRPPARLATRWGH